MVFKKNHFFKFCQRYGISLATEDVINNNSFMEGMSTPASTILEYENTYEKYVESHTRVEATALSKIIADLSYDIKELKERC